MKHRPILRIALRLWIGLTSLFSFLMGWGMLAYSSKTVQSSPTPVSSVAPAVNPLPTLAPLPALDLTGNSTSSGSQVLQFSIQQAQPPTGNGPAFRTGGS
jgi:hypothetical protein